MVKEDFKELNINKLTLGLKSKLESLNKVY